MPSGCGTETAFGRCAERAILPADRPGPSARTRPERPVAAAVAAHAAALPPRRARRGAVLRRILRAAGRRPFGPARDGRSHSGTVLKPERNRNGAGAEPGAPGTCGRGGRMAAMRCGWPGAAAPAAPQNHLRAGDGGPNLSAEHPPATDEGGTDNRIPVACIAGRPGAGRVPGRRAECHRAGAAADAGRENLPGGCFLTAGMV